MYLILITLYPIDPDIVLVFPHSFATGEASLRTKIAAHLVTNYGLTLSAAKRILPLQLSFWGKLKVLNKGDMIHAKDLTKRAQTDQSRDATFIKVRLVNYN